MLAVEGAVEDLAAIVVGHEFAVARLPQRLSFIGKSNGSAPDRGHQIRRASIDWNFEDRAGEPGAVDDRFVITGQQSCAVTQLGYAQRPKVAFEEQPGLFFRKAASIQGPAPERDRRRCVFAKEMRLGCSATSSFAKSWHRLRVGGCRRPSRVGIPLRNCGRWT